MNTEQKIRNLNEGDKLKEILLEQEIRIQMLEEKLNG